ncbi:hypothetical protein IF2G_09277 [Cordyceps javanica]|nr:hypothetical protein IF2G_09277 [Cordyceps javanica]
MGVAIHRDSWVLMVSLSLCRWAYILVVLIHPWSGFASGGARHGPRFTLPRCSLLSVSSCVCVFRYRLARSPRSPRAVYSVLTKLLSTSTTAASLGRA